MKKLLKLQIQNSNGETLVTHHFNFNCEEHNKLVLTVDEHQYVLNSKGRLVDNVKHKTNG